jgi:hypothetical protein
LNKLFGLLIEKHAIFDAGLLVAHTNLEDYLEEKNSELKLCSF